MNGAHASTKLLIWTPKFSHHEFPKTFKTQILNHKNKKTDLEFLRPHNQRGDNAICIFQKTTCAGNIKSFTLGVGYFLVGYFVQFSISKITK